MFICKVEVVLKKNKNLLFDNNLEFKNGKNKLSLLVKSAYSFLNHSHVFFNILFFGNQWKLMLVSTTLRNASIFCILVLLATGFTI